MNNDISVNRTFVRRNPQELMDRLHRGDPLTQDEYSFLASSGYLPNFGAFKTSFGATVSPSEVAAAGMFARNEMRANGMMHRQQQSPGANVIRWG